MADEKKSSISRPSESSISRRNESSISRPTGAAPVVTDEETRLAIFRIFHERLLKELDELQQNPILVDFYPVEFLGPLRDLNFGLGRAIYVRFKVNDFWYTVYAVFPDEYPMKSPVVVIRNQSNRVKATKAQPEHWSPACTLRSALTDLVLSLLE